MRTGAPSTTYALPLGGGRARAFPDDTTHAAEARWSPDGRRVAYTAGGQLWVANADGSGRRQLTTLNGGASGPVWSPTGDRIAFVSAVWPDCTTDACNAAEGQGQGRQQGQGARRRQPDVPPLERVGRRHALASVRRRRSTATRRAT